MKPGDVFGTSSYDLIGVVNNLATDGIPCVDLSHVGIFAAAPDGRLRLFEVTTSSAVPCLIQGKRVSGVQCVSIKDRIASYRGRVYHYPLYRSLYEHESRRLTEYLVSQIGSPYSVLGAIESGGWFGILADAISRIRQRFHIVPKRAKFCSRLVAGGASAIGLLPTDDDAKWNPNRLVRCLRHREILLPPVRIK